MPARAVIGTYTGEYRDINPPNAADANFSVLLTDNNSQIVNDIKCKSKKSQLIHKGFKIGRDSENCSRL